MDFGSPIFVVALMAVAYGAWLINNWIRAKHGYDLEDEWGGKTSPRNTERENAETERLRAENSELNNKLDAMQDRMVVLERIVTDRGYTLSEEIEALRDVPAPELSDSRNDSGVPLNLASKEKQS